MAAMLIGAGIRAGVTVIKQSVQATKDFNNPDGPQVRYDRKGRVKRPGAVYGLVTKGLNANQQRKQGKDGKEAKEGEHTPVGSLEVSKACVTDSSQGSSSSHLPDTRVQPESQYYEAQANEQSYRKSDYSSEDYGPQSKQYEAQQSRDADRYVSSLVAPDTSDANAQNAELPPPAYNEISSSSQPRTHDAFGPLPGAGPSYSTQQYAPAPLTASPSYGAPQDRRDRKDRRGSVSSSSSDSSGAGVAPGPRPGPSMVGMSKAEYKIAKREMKMQRKMLRAERKAARRGYMVPAAASLPQERMMMNQEREVDYQRRLAQQQMRY